MSKSGDPFDAVHEVVSTLRAYELEHLSLSITGAVDAVEISLVALRPDGGVSLSIRDVHYFSIERFPGREIPFVDLTATTLFPSAPWPPELPDEFSEPRPSHPLLWLRAHGATTLRLVAAVVIVLRQVH